MKDELKTELKEFIKENINECAEAMDREYAISFPRAYGVIEKAENNRLQSIKHLEWMCDILEDGDMSPYFYGTQLSDALYDKNDPELTLFASWIAGLLAQARAITPVIAKNCINDRKQAGRLLEALEQFVQENIEYNCQRYCETIKQPRALLSRWNSTTLLRERMPEGETLGKRFLDDKEYLRIQMKTLDAPDTHEKLTSRENLVLRQLLQGQSNAEIAASIHVSLSTVKQQVSSILRKFGVASRAELIAQAKASGYQAQD